MSPYAFEPLAHRLKPWQLFIEKYKIYLLVLFFFSGFLFDLLTLQEPDNPRSLLQQSLYLVLAAWFLFAPFDISQGGWKAKLASWQPLIIQFLFGSLLSIYSIFFFRSASLGLPLLLVLFVATLLVINELPRLKGFERYTGSLIWVICLSGFFTLFVPTLLGFIGFIPFLISLLSTALALTLLLFLLHRGEVKATLEDPLFHVSAIFIGLYFLVYSFGWIPPVPLAAQKVGVYHEVQREGEEYHLRYARSRWKFWQRGAQDFAYRPGDRVYFYARILAPRRFDDQLVARWFFQQGDSWVQTDAIPVPIRGGREEGFRGFVYKSNVAAGDWYVRLDTSDGRAVTTLSLRIHEDTSTEERDFRVVID